MYLILCVYIYIYINDAVVSLTNQIFRCCRWMLVTRCLTNMLFKIFVYLFIAV